MMVRNGMLREVGKMVVMPMIGSYLYKVWGKCTSSVQGQ